MRRPNPNYIVCIVDPTDNCYDYETAGEMECYINGIKDEWAE